MTTSRNEESTTASAPETHATAEATGAAGPSARTAPAKRGTTNAARPSAPREEAAEGEAKTASASVGTAAGASEAGRAPETKGEGEEEAQNKTGSAEASTATATTATATAAAAGSTAETATSEEEEESTSTATSTTTDAEAPEKAGRPNKALLAGAAIAGVLLVAVPFLVHVGDGDDGKRDAANGEAPGTVLGSGQSGIPGAYASATPSPRDSPGKESAAGRDGKADSSSADGAHGSGPINEGGSSAGGSSAGADASGEKSTGDVKTTTGKAGTGTTGTTGTGSTSSSTSTGTTQKSAPVSTVVYTGVAGHGCATPAGGGYQQDGYFTEGTGGWYTRSSGGWTGDGCNGSYAAVPMSGDTAVDADSRVKWWWKPGTTARTCQISVFVPNSNTTLYVGGHPTTYHVLVNANDRTTKYSSFTINQVAHRGQWVNAGTFTMKGSTIGVKLLDRGDDWSNGWETAHHAAAQMKATCRS
ncbi:MULTISPECIES: hypothetical protein [unclassified Streptomyces]|uniref:hypothetical protein n=1 Tax=unclassified Streptomyces TaxID=2593676 RepID=UPI0036E9FF67